MAYEITTNQATGLTLTARLVLTGAYVGAVITLTESGTVIGHYTGTPPGGTAAALYGILVFNGTVRVGEGILRWDGTAEILPAPAADTTTLLSRVTAAPLLASAYTAPDNAGVAAIKAKTDALPAAPAAVGDIPTAATVASAVWGAVTRTLTAGTLTAADVWASVTRSLTTAAAPTAAANAAAVRVEIAPELGRLDVPISTRNSVAPDNASVAAIKAKTDALPADPASQSVMVLADVRKINNVTVAGAGIDGNVWRPA